MCIPRWTPWQLGLLTTHACGDRQATIAPKWAIGAFRPEELRPMMPNS